MPSQARLVPAYDTPIRETGLAQTALPLIVAAAGSNNFTTTIIQVPDKEVWVVIACGITLQTTAVGLNVSAAMEVFAGNRTLRVGGGAGSVWVPVQVSIISGSAYGLSISLEGVQLNEGDSIRLWVYASNPTGGAITMSDAFGAIRYTPLYMVSEQAVVRLEQGRTDLALDARLRGTRG